MLAANAFGPRRTRYGAVRDLVIGITVVRADGVLAHGGGKVVKNVAGFDLPRLFCGSLGTLGLVAEVVFRLHPLPEASATAVFEGLSGVDVAGDDPVLRELAVEPTAVRGALFAHGRQVHLAVRFEGFAPGVRDQVGADARARGRRRDGSDGAEEAALWARHDALRARARVRARPPSRRRRSSRRSTRSRRCAARSGRRASWSTRPSGSRSSPGELADAGRRGRRGRGLRARRAPPLANGALVVSAAPPRAPRARRRVGPRARRVEVMRRLKRELDPDGAPRARALRGGI